MPEGRRPFSVSIAQSLAFRLAYVVVIILATIAEPGEAPKLGWVPGLERALALHVTGRDLIDAVRNILLFAGWGAVWVVTSRPGPARSMLVKATLTGAALSLAAEIGQLLVGTRVASALDLLTNTTGSLVGAFSAAMLIVAARAGLGRRSYLGIPTLLPAASYFIATLSEAVSPYFRQRRLPGAWGTPLERLQEAWAHFAWSSVVAIPWFEVLLFAPAGLLGVAALLELGLTSRRAVSPVVGLATVSYLGAELARGASGYPMVLGAVLGHVVAVGVGAWLAPRCIPAFSRSLQGRDRPAAVLVPYVFLLALWVLRPFVPEFDLGAIADKLAPDRLMPLLAYRQRADLYSAADVAIPAFLLLPVGALLAVWPLRLAGWLSGVLPAVYVIALLEAGQLVVVGRWFDLTDIMVASAAALLGWIIMRRAGYRPYGAILPAPRGLVARSTGGRAH